MKSKTYDCFNFFNELDVLELRLNILYDYVDYFVIVESSVTHSGEEKPFYFDDNKERFLKFSDKIISYKVYDTPTNFTELNNSSDEQITQINKFINTQTNRFNRATQNDYGRDFYQKECVRRPLINCNDNDIIIISDADEIPNPKLIEQLNSMLGENEILSLNQATYYYYLNVLKQYDWYGSKIGRYKTVKNISFNEIRGDEALTKKVPNGGWHFSFQGGSDMVIKKITSYSARDLANDFVINNINNNIESNQDPFFRGALSIVPIDETYPKYLLNNLEKYNHMIK